MTTLTEKLYQVVPNTLKRYILLQSLIYSISGDEVDDEVVMDTRSKLWLSNNNFINMSLRMSGGVDWAEGVKKSLRNTNDINVDTIDNIVRTIPDSLNYGSTALEANDISTVLSTLRQ